MCFCRPLLHCAASFVLGDGYACWFWLGLALIAAAFMACFYGNLNACQIAFQTHTHARTHATRYAASPTAIGTSCRCCCLLLKRDFDYCCCMSSVQANLQRWGGGVSKRDGERKTNRRGMPQSRAKGKEYAQRRKKQIKRLIWLPAGRCTLCAHHAPVCLVVAVTMCRRCWPSPERQFQYLSPIVATDAKIMPHCKPANRECLACWRCWCQEHAMTAMTAMTAMPVSSRMAWSYADIYFSICQQQQQQMRWRRTMADSRHFYMI